MHRRYSSIAHTIVQVFASRGAEPIEVPTVQPADPFLDVMGEQQHGCLFLTESENQEALCLRPEFTIPVCLEHIRCEVTNPRRYVYFDKSFRKRPPSRNGLLQAGLVDLGDPDVPTADARSITDAYTLLQLTVSRRELVTVIGDQEIFEAVLSALQLPRRWQKRLIRGSGLHLRHGAPRADVGQPLPAKNLDAVVKGFLTRADCTAITAYVTNLMTHGGFSRVAGRTPSEIATRLIESTELSSTRVSQSTFDALNSFLSIRSPLDRAVDEITKFAGSAGLTLGIALDNFVRRAEVLEREGVPLGQLTYDASFSRRLDHHTGLLFEIRAPESDRPLASGGRYDRLPALLGADRHIPAIGLSVFVDEIELPQGTLT
ncbi:ATP phosphoribosyltransferase regulatory subunit [Paraburkholderia phenoliruptrix]|uniref:ATP phosphoribosyltransferase regulatory subunit n=1 Tax=Paraburkholderia phenoliruptrix BR3459a TaxID=1229205 RepID=K0E3T1_9BURK|nr:ATP phosphoribosyltransferase regulatory subunit [Paraburkholderia phenoliruptrix]AFT90519.1 ATP phosphoribosyltransferase regulatory subunit [Paraburkholderia phenoliruptrix BR3459a]